MVVTVLEPDGHIPGRAPGLKALALVMASRQNLMLEVALRIDGVSDGSCWLMVNESYWMVVNKPQLKITMVSTQNARIWGCLGFHHYVHTCAVCVNMFLWFSLHIYIYILDGTQHFNEWPELHCCVGKCIEFRVVALWMVRINSEHPKKFSNYDGCSHDPTRKGHSGLGEAAICCKTTSWEFNWLCEDYWHVQVHIVAIMNEYRPVYQALS